MKRCLMSMTCFISLISSSVVIAAPYHYTFSGTINYIELDGEFLSDIDIDGDPATTIDSFMVGDTIEYTFLVDFDLPGFCAGPLGTTYSSTCTGVNIPDAANINYFFTDLVSASKLAPPTEEGTTFNYGLSLSNLGSLIADSAVFIVSPYDIPVENWVATSSTTPGSILDGTDAWAMPNGGSPYGRVNSTLTLISITPVLIDECVKEKDNEDSKNDDSDNSDDGDNDDMSKNDNYKNDDEEDEDERKYNRENGEQSEDEQENDDNDSSSGNPKDHSESDKMNSCKDKHKNKGKKKHNTDDSHSDDDGDETSHHGDREDNESSDRNDDHSDQNYEKQKHQSHTSNESCPLGKNYHKNNRITTDINDKRKSSSSHKNKRKHKNKPD